MRVAIIGAGIAGLIAEGAVLKTFGNDITVFDTKEGKGLSKSHKAIMRLRNDSIKEYVNCSLDRIKVQKGVYHEDAIYTTPNLLLNNLYSKKVYGALGHRSLSSLGTVERFLISKIITSEHNYRREKVVGFSKNREILLDSGEKFAYDVCISTIPLPSLLSLSSVSDLFYEGVIFKYKTIYVTNIKLLIDSDVHQTLYFTNQDHDMPYRATIQFRDIILESIFDNVRTSTIQVCLKAFGLSLFDINNETITTNSQKFGKIDPIDDSVRRQILMDITDEYNIYSLGRFATWRPLRIDQVVEDVKRIILLIKVKNRSYYIDHDEK